MQETSDRFGRDIDTALLPNRVGDLSGGAM